jgi:hypothetical protein
MRTIGYRLLALTLLAGGTWLVARTLIDASDLNALATHGCRTLATITSSWPHATRDDQPWPRSGGYLQVTFHTKGGTPVNAAIPVDSSARLVRKTDTIEVVYLPDNPSVVYASDGDGMMRPIQEMDRLTAGGLIGVGGLILLAAQLPSRRRVKHLKTVTLTGTTSH